MSYHKIQMSLFSLQISLDLRRLDGLDNFLKTILTQNFINNLTECKWFSPCQVICNQLSKFRKFDVDFVHLACMNCVGPTLFEQDHRQVRTAGTHDGQHPNNHDKCAGTDDGGADHQ